MKPEATYFVTLLTYLIAVVGIGIFAGKKAGRGSDYFLGGRSIGPWITAFSFVAAYFSSVLIIGGGGFGYKYGMATLWVGAINVLVGCFLVWAVLGRRIRHMSGRLNAQTVPDFFGKRFESGPAKLFSAAVIIIFLIIYNVAVLKGMGNALEVLMGWKYWIAVLIAGALILIYVAVGGYFAVVWTSFVQAWIMIFGLLFLTIFVLLKVGGLESLNASLAAIDYGFIQTPGIWGWGGIISFSLIVSFGVWGMPQLIVRFFTIKSTKLLILGTVLATLGGTIALLPYINGAAARALYPDLAVLYPGIDPGKVADLAIPTLVKDILPPWAGGILLAGVVAAGMSTFSAILIKVSSSVVHDVLQHAVKRKFSEKKAVLWGRLVSIIAGLISLSIAIRPPNLILIITAFAWAVIASTTLWPMLFGVYWKRASKTAVIASMISGAAVSLIWQIMARSGWKPLSLLNIHGFIPGMIVGLIVIVVVSFMSKRPGTTLLENAFGISKDGDNGSQ